MTYKSKPYTEKTKTITRGWPPKRRAEQAARLHHSKIWLKSTGPKTSEGKKTCSQNAYKHGLQSHAYKLQKIILRRLLKMQRAYLKNYKRQKHLERALLISKNYDLPDFNCEAAYPFPTSFQCEPASLHDAPAS